MTRLLAQDVAVALADLARDQYGVVSYDQLIAIGCNEDGVRTWIRTRRLIPLHRGVYAVGYVPKIRETVWMAATLACPSSVLSHRSAAALWGLRLGETLRPHVSVGTRNGRRQPDIVVHRVDLPAVDATSWRGIPCTSVARTLADLSPLVTADEMYLAIREAMYLRLFSLSAVEEVLTRKRCRLLRVMVEDLTFTQERLEMDFRRLCSRYGVPAPSTQQRVEGARVDFLWPAERVVVETDGWRAHGTPAAFQADRAKTNLLTAAGWRVLRFTHADVTRRPAKTARTMLRVLGAKPAV